MLQRERFPVPGERWQSSGSIVRIVTFDHVDEEIADGQLVGPYMNETRYEMAVALEEIDAYSLCVIFDTGENFQALSVDTFLAVNDSNAPLFERIG